MALTNRPKKSGYQVGETVYFLNGKKGASAEVIKVQSIVTNPDNNNTGKQENVYYLEGMSNGYREEELFHSMNALMFNIKGDYLMKMGNSEQVTIAPGTLLSLCDYSYGLMSIIDLPTVFSEVNFDSCILDGCDFRGATLNNAVLSNASLINANMELAYLSGALLTNTDCKGTNFTGATLPASANTKSSFKTTVGAGRWDAETTIWTDGLPIGN